MPGNSLWLIPPLAHPLTATLRALISEKLPAIFAPYESPLKDFQPHITITSDIPTSLSGADLQTALDDLPVPPELPVKFKSVVAGYSTSQPPRTVNY